MDKNILGVKIIKFCFFSFVTLILGCGDPFLERDTGNDRPESKKIISSLYEQEALIVEDESDGFVAAFKSGNISFVFRSERKGLKISSTLEVGGENGFVESHIEIDENLMGYKFDVHELVLSEANRIIEKA